MRMKILLVIVVISLITLVLSCSTCSEKIEEVKKKTEEMKGAKELYEKAVICEKVGDYEKAVEYYDKLLEIAPEEGGLWNAKGLALFYQGKYVEAADAFKMAVKYPDENWKLYSYIFLYIGKSADGSEDISIIKPALEGDDKEWPYSVIRYFAGEITEDELMDEAGDDKGRLCEVHCYIGYIHKFAGDEDIAKQHFKASLATGETKFVEYKMVECELGE
jgi:lipoprotein NlpI